MKTSGHSKTVATVLKNDLTRNVSRFFREQECCQPSDLIRICRTLERYVTEHFFFVFRLAYSLQRATIAYDLLPHRCADDSRRDGVNPDAVRRKAQSSAAR